MLEFTIAFLIVFGLCFAKDGYRVIFRTPRNQTPKNVEADVRILMDEMNYRSRDPNVPIGGFGPRAEARQHANGGHR